MHESDIRPAPIAGLEKTVGHTFENKELVRTALTHSSYSNEQRAHGVGMKCNERLEFLGDSVLSIIVSDYLFATHPDMPEGELSKVRAGTICERALAGFAREIKLGDYLYLGRGEEKLEGRSRPSILADAFEALLAAIYLDSNIEEVSRFLLPFAEDEISRILSSGHTADYKTILQEIIQQNPEEHISYEVTEEEGEAHHKTFTADVMLNGQSIGTGSGQSKKEAEQAAAKEAIGLMGYETD